MPPDFTHFAAIDWSGAKGSAHPGIAVAVCARGAAAPVLVTPPARHWSRSTVLEWVRAQNTSMLTGFDFSFAPPLIERGSYLPGDNVPLTARAFWAYVDNLCDDIDLGAASFLETHHRRHFYFGAADGAKATFLHHRVCEMRYNAGGGGKASTVYDAIGAAQVAKASFAGMRVLHHLGQDVPVWPIDPLPTTGSLVVEIYTTIAARAAGLRKGLSKVRDDVSLDNALAALGCDAHKRLPHYSDHATDAILTAAWIRANAGNAALWAPPALSPQIAVTEGWTFGVA